MPGLDLRQGGVERQAASGAGVEVGELLALEQDRLTRELLDAFEVGAAGRVGRRCGKCGVICHEEGVWLRRLTRRCRRKGLGDDHCRLRYLPGRGPRGS